MYSSLAYLLFKSAPPCVTLGFSPGRAGVFFFPPLVAHSMGSAPANRCNFFFKSKSFNKLNREGHYTLQTVSLSQHSLLNNQIKLNVFSLVDNMFSYILLVYIFMIILLYRALKNLLLERLLLDQSSLVLPVNSFLSPIKMGTEVTTERIRSILEA